MREMYKSKTGIKTRTPKTRGEEKKKKKKIKQPHLWQSKLWLFFPHNLLLANLVLTLWAEDYECHQVLEMLDSDVRTLKVNKQTSVSNWLAIALSHHMHIIPMYDWKFISGAAHWKLDIRDQKTNFCDLNLNKIRPKQKHFSVLKKIFTFQIKLFWWM